MNKNIINGNNAIEVQQQSPETVKRRKKRRNPKHKVSTIRNIAIVFVVGVVLVARYSMIYNMQLQLTSIQNRVDDVNRQNENLTVELVKYNNLEYIEDNAIHKLHMIQPQKSSAVYADLNKPIINQETSDKDDSSNIIQKIIKQFKWR
jgi:cell division protein FtsL